MCMTPQGEHGNSACGVGYLNRDVQTPVGGPGVLGDKGILDGMASQNMPKVWFLKDCARYAGDAHLMVRFRGLIRGSGTPFW